MDAAFFFLAERGGGRKQCHDGLTRNPACKSISPTMLRGCCESKITLARGRLSPSPFPHNLHWLAWILSVFRPTPAANIVFKSCREHFHFVDPGEPERAYPALPARLLARALASRAPPACPRASLHAPSRATATPFPSRPPRAPARFRLSVVVRRLS